MWYIYEMDYYSARKQPDSQYQHLLQLDELELAAQDESHQVPKTTYWTIAHA